MIFKSNSMSIHFKDAVSYLSFKALDEYKFFKHAYSTRIGGVSSGEFKSMNLGLKTKDSPENISKNFNIFCDSFGINKDKLAITSQIHEDKIQVIKDKSINSFTVFEGTDGIVTNQPGISIATFHADCMAIYMVDVKNKVVGLAHAGWRGTVKNIAGKLAQKFFSEYNSSKENIICALGPSIGECCFEVSEDVIEKFSELDLTENYINGNKINLAQVNKSLLINAGLKEKNIFLSDVCTMCNKDLVFSHRATQGKRGTNAAFISII